MKRPILTIHRLWMTLLLGLLMTGTAFVSNAVAQGDGHPTLTVIAAALSVRAGPSMTYPVVDYLRQDAQVTAIDYDAASDWWQVELPDGKSGWVSGSPYYVSVTGDTTAFREQTPAQPETNINNSQFTIPNSPLGTIVFQTVSGGPIYAINPDTLASTGGANLRYLTTGLDPVLSPDGQWVAFTRWDGVHNGAFGSVWVINIDGTGERVILNDVRQPKSPTWSADGSQIVISMQQGGPRLEPTRQCGTSRPPSNAYDIEVSRGDSGQIKFCYTLPADPHWGLRIVDVATGEFEDLPDESYSFSPTWDPANGWRLVYDGDLGLVNLDLSQNTSWPLTEDVNDHSPVFSPDGSRLAVSYHQDDHWEIHVMNADGSDRQRLTETSYLTLVEQQLRGEQPHSYNNAAPVWSPDGSQLAFITDRTGQWEIWVMNADGSDQRPLVPSEALVGIPLQYNGVDERVLTWR